MLANQDYLKELKANNVEINTWTVNEPQYIDMMIAAGVDGIIGNNPDVVKERLIKAGLR